MAANSTLMFSGFNPNSRNSSKVLRPPGGGSSDIFGLKVNQEEDRVDPAQEEERVDPAVQEDKDNLPVEDSTTTTDEVSNTNDDGEPGEDIQSSAAETPSEESSNTPTESTTPLPESASPPVVPTSSSDPSPTPPVAGVRGRIPPGGHSSGSFW